MLGLLLAKKGRGDSWRSHGQPCRGVLQLPVHKFGVLRYPYFSTPTGAPGPGPYTVPSVVGPGPNSARARVAWVALLLNSVPAAPSPGGARLSRRRGGRGVRGVRDVGGVRGAEPRRHASRRARFLYSERRSVRSPTPPFISGGEQGRFAIPPVASHRKISATSFPPETAAICP